MLKSLWTLLHALNRPDSDDFRLDLECFQSLGANPAHAHVGRNRSQKGGFFTF